MGVRIRRKWMVNVYEADGLIRNTVYRTRRAALDVIERAIDAGNRADLFRNGIPIAIEAA